MADIKTLVEEAKQQFHACIGFALNDDDTLHSAGPHAIAALDAIAEAHQAEVARLTRENEGLAKALGEIAWSNDSKWQCDRARAALAGASGAADHRG